MAGRSDRLVDRELYWRFGEQRALRRGSWKYYGYMGEIELLFDLDADPGEERDLSQARPDVLVELQGLYQEWEAELVAPLWEVPMNLSTRAKALKRRYGLEVPKPR